MLDRRTIRFWVIIVLAMTGMLAAGAAIGGGRELPLSQCSDLYRQYAGRTDIQATFVKDFHVNDSVALDVTLLTATDSAGWETLKKDFNVHELDEHTQRKIDCGIDIVTMRLAPKKDPTLPMDTTDRLNNNAVAVSRLHHTVSVFQTNTMEEQHEILYYQLKIGLPKK